MLRQALALRATARFATLVALAATVTSTAACEPEVADPIGLDAEALDVDARMHRASREPTNIQFGDFALHVPANVRHVRGILLTLGGPDTRGFAVGAPFGAPLPQVEAALQELGGRFRELAAERALAILGSGRFGPGAYPNDPTSDQLLLDAVALAAALTGRPELGEAPFLVYGVSGGAREAIGFTERHPDRVKALFLKVPVAAGPLTGQALEIPGYMVLAELDAFVNNPALKAAFETHRAAGAPWALALEPGVVHHSLSVAQMELTVDWMRTILRHEHVGRRHQTGWLGDPATGEIAPARRFSGDPTKASWFPRRRPAEAWAAFIGF